MDSGIWMKRRAKCDCGLVVLLAEDDDALRSVLARGIRENGHEVVELEDGERVIDFLRGYEGDPWHLFLVTDVRMPKRSGLEVLAELRAARYRMRSVVTTGFPDEQTHRLARALGALAVFQKPFETEDLCTAIDFLGHAPHSLP